MKPTLADRAEYLLFAGATGLGVRLRPAAADRLGSWLGGVAYHLLRTRRSVVEGQLRLAFPDRDAAWVRATAAACYRHLGREALAMLRLAGATPAGIVERTCVAGLEPLERVLAAGRGAVIVTGHLGNWEIGAAALVARGIPIDGFAQMQRNPLVNRAILEARARLGLRVFDRRGAIRRSLEALREGRVPGFVADQDARRAGVFVPFFGRLASTSRGPALVAIRAGVPLFVGIALRRPDGRYDVRVEEVESDRGGPRDAAIERLTAAFTARLEAAVREAPAQYFWLHRRWKTRPREELGGTGGSIT
jgi:KDO2-lipid IV(A) lauroyltransferase